MRRFWLLATVLFAACGGRGAPCPRSGAVYVDQPAAKADGAAPQANHCQARR